MRAGPVAVAAMLLVPARARADEWLGRDKALHFGASAVIASGGYAITTAFDERRSVALLIGGGSALLAGVGKETVDALGYGTPSWKDLAWDVAGAAVGLALAYGVDALLRRSEPRATSAALIRF